MSIRRLRAKVDDPFLKANRHNPGMGYSFVAVKNNEKIIYNRPFNLLLYFCCLLLALEL